MPETPDTPRCSQDFALDTHFDTQNYTLRLDKGLVMKSERPPSQRRGSGGGGGLLIDFITDQKMFSTPIKRQKKLLEL